MNGDRPATGAGREGRRTFFTGAAAAVAGVIAVTAFQLAAAAVDNTRKLLATAALALAGLIVVYGWNSRYSAPAVFVIGGIIGVALLGWECGDAPLWLEMDTRSGRDS